MTTDPLTQISTRRTPQTSRAFGSEGARQSKNNAGGYVFRVDDDARLMRFLTLGTDGGTYYTSERDLTVQNAQVVLDMARTNGVHLVEKIVEVSVAGRAPRQNPALFALAVATGSADEATRKAAFAAIPSVVRIGTHLFIFLRYMQQFRGWGDGIMKAVSKWYTDKTTDQLAYQLLKYRQREGWSHRDVLRSAHPGRWSVIDDSQRALFAWVAAKSPVQSSGIPGALPELVNSFMVVQTSTSVDTWVSEIERHNISWEMLPDAAMNEPKVWSALIRKGLPITALIRQLPRLTKLGLFDNAEIRSIVTARLQDVDVLRKGRVHPINVLVAMRTYAQGHGERGNMTWTPNSKIIDALDGAFYAAFGTVEPANKRTLIAMDVSGSMGWATTSGLPITPREASAAIAMVTMATEPETTVVGFTFGSSMNSRRYRASRYGGYSDPSAPVKVDGNGVSELTISKRQRLDDAVRSISNLAFGGTDASLPLLWAKEKGLLFDTVIVITDNETYGGGQHVFEALRDYREWSGLATREIVVGMTATDFTIADPNDPLTLDVAGFDSAVPNLMSAFSRGDI